MSFDDIVAEANAVEASLSQSETSPTAEADSLDIVALAETVARINRATEDSILETTKAARVISDAPEKLNHAVREGFQESLKELNEKERVLARRSIAIDKRGLFWLLTVLSTALVFGALLFAGLVFWLVPEIARYSEYRDSHRVLEQGSVFGAQVVENENGVFISFDEGVIVKANCSDMENCVSVMKSK